MVSFKKIIELRDGSASKGALYKNDLAKRAMIGHIAADEGVTVAEIAENLNISVPTAAKLIGELIADGLVCDLGKSETAGGRRPNVFGLEGGAAYFAGIGIGRDRLDLVVTDLSNNTVASHTELDFHLEDNPQTLEKILWATDDFIAGSNIPRGWIVAAGVAVPGRVNTSSGVSYRYFNDPDRPLRIIFEERFGIEVSVENNTRAKCYAEYLSRKGEGVHNMLYVNIDYGFGIGIVADGKPYYGKSGFAGEFGHTSFFDNNLICSCGKRGCLETEVSGFAVENKMKTLIAEDANTLLSRRETVLIDNIIDAAMGEDTLSIELIEEVAGKAGKSIAMLLNIFNPDAVIIGGTLMRAGNYLMLPLQTAVNKHSLNLVYNDTRFGIAQTDARSGALGAAIMMRNKIIGLL